jgi:hypothetical protein
MNAMLFSDASISCLSAATGSDRQLMHAAGLSSSQESCASSLLGIFCSLHKTGKNISACQVAVAQGGKPPSTIWVFMHSVAFISSLVTSTSTRTVDTPSKWHMYSCTTSIRQCGISRQTCTAGPAVIHKIPSTTGQRVRM